MPRLHEVVETTLPLEQTFAFIADFANNPIWDPGTVSAERLDAGPVEPGARYRLLVRFGSGAAPMTYTITELHPDQRVVLRGEGDRVRAVDDIRFAATPSGGTRIDYTADLELTGWLRFVQPFLGGTFRKIGAQARTGMQRALAERASAVPTQAAATPGTTR